MSRKMPIIIPRAGSVQSTVQNPGLFVCNDTKPSQSPLQSFARSTVASPLEMWLERLINSPFNFQIKDPSIDWSTNRLIASAPSTINSLMEITAVSRGSKRTNTPPAPRNILWNVWKTPPTAAKLFPHHLPLPLRCSYCFVPIQHPAHTTNCDMSNRNDLTATRF